MTSPATITAGERAIWGLGVLISLCLGASALLAVIVVDDSRRPPWQMGPSVPAYSLLLPVVGAAVAGGACAGLAASPASVVRRGTRRHFVAAVTLGALTLLLAIPTPLALFTWPMALVTGAVAVLLFRRAFRGPPGVPTTLS